MPTFTDLGTVILRQANDTNKFFPGTLLQRAWDSTSLSAFLTCPRKYKFAQIDKIIPSATAEALALGICFHTAIEAFYNTAQTSSIDDAYHAALQIALGYLWSEKYSRYLEPLTSARSRDNLVAAVVAYCDTYVADEEYSCAIVNNAPATELSFNFFLPFGPSSGDKYIYCGHFDRLAVSSVSALTVFDYKTTTKTLNQYFAAAYERSPQMLGYHMAVLWLFNKLQKLQKEQTAPTKIFGVAGVVVEAVQLRQPPELRRILMQQSTKEVANFLQDLQAVLAHAELCATRQYWPRNNSACAYCDYRPICSATSEIDFNSQLQAGFTTREWNPLVPR